MRQEKEVEDAPTVEGWVSQAGKANQEEISLKAKLRPVSAKLSKQAVLQFVYSVYSFYFCFFQSDKALMDS